MRATGALKLTMAIEEVPGVGKTRGAALRRLGIPTLAHLIHAIPTRYERHEAEASIAELRAGQIVSARGEVTATRVAGRSPQSKRFEAVLVDHTGRLDLVWFNGAYLRHKIHPGVRLRVQGKSRRLGANLQLANAAYEVIDDEEESAKLEGGIRPVYAASEAIGSKAIAGIVAGALEEALPLIRDHLPDAHRRKRELPTLAEAYRMAHAPKSEAEWREATRRLAYDELLLMQLGVHMKRAHDRRTHKAHALRLTAQIDAHIRARLPFTLTPAQDMAVKEICADLSRETPANRLIQGDVGAGKTVVALYAMLLAVARQKQAALMAPTELLAEQHYGTIAGLLEGSRVRVRLLTGSLPAPEREGLEAAIATGEVDIVVGTHALLTDSVRFRSLTVAVVDEQHRFGVHQRARIRQRSKEDGEERAPHTLVMTATPIPRTLALTIFGDLDVTTIRGLPAGRRRIATRVVGPDRSAEVYGFVRSRLEAGEQAYVVLPTIDGTGEGAGLTRDVRSTLRRLEDGPLRGLRLAALHGRLKRETREQIMGRFRAGLIDALVATTVIEVGVDVPNATIMVVEHAERFGLAQLHQLRGRVGRGAKASACVLIASPTTPDSEARLKAIASSADGFVLAEEDLAIRGPGELIGSRQSGLPPFRVADLTRDMDLLALARRDAAEWIERSPLLEGPEEHLLRARLMKTWGEPLQLPVDVG